MGWFTGGIKWIGSGIKDTVHNVGDALSIDDEVEKFLDDLTKGIEDISGKTAAEDAAKTQAEQYDRMSQAIKDQANVMGEEAAQSATNLVNDSNASLSNTLNLAAALGGVGFKVNAVPKVGSTGIDVGTEESQATRDLKAQLATLTGTITAATTARDTAKTSYETAVGNVQAEADKIKDKRDAYLAAKKAYNDKLSSLGDDRNGHEEDAEKAALDEAERVLSDSMGPYNEAKAAATKAKADLDKANATIDENTPKAEDLTSRLDEITKFSEGVGDVALPDQAKFAEGSMSANLATMRDRFQQARNTYVRGVQTDLSTFMTERENYDAQAALTRRAGEVSGWQSMFAFGGTILGGAVGAYYGGPKGAAMGMTFGQQAGGYSGNYYAGRM